MTTATWSGGVRVLLATPPGTGRTQRRLAATKPVMASSVKWAGSLNRRVIVLLLTEREMDQGRSVTDRDLSAGTCSTRVSRLRRTSTRRRFPKQVHRWLRRLRRWRAWRR